MTNITTKHVSIHFNLAKQSSDDDLRKVYAGPASADPARAIRKQIAELEDQGIHYFPCGCKTLNADGSCAGAMDGEEQV
jgi:hypothetical protein